MDISSSSWLYKFWKFNGDTYDLRNGRVTLCKMFWLTLFYLVKCTFFLGIILVILTMPGPFILAQLGFITSAKGFLAAGTTYVWWIYPLAAVAGCIGWSLIVGVLTAIIWPVSKLVKWISYKRDETKFTRAIKKEMARDEDLHFGNIWQKFKIMKEEKLCPIIRVVDKN